MAILGGSIGMGEWLMLFIVVLVVVGPKRLPEVARKFGKTMEMFRKAADEFKEQLMSMDQEVKDTVGDAAEGIDIDGVEGDEGPDDAYGDSYDYDAGAYADEADYPGNEDMVSEWEDESGSVDDAIKDNLETPDQTDLSASAGEDSSVENSGDSAVEHSDDPARGETASTEEKA